MQFCKTVKNCTVTCISWLLSACQTCFEIMWNVHVLLSQKACKILNIILQLYKTCQAYVIQVLSAIDNIGETIEEPNCARSKGPHHHNETAVSFRGTNRFL